MSDLPGHPPIRSPAVAQLHRPQLPVAAAKTTGRRDQVSVLKFIFKVKSAKINFSLPVFARNFHFRKFAEHFSDFLRTGHLVFGQRHRPTPQGGSAATRHSSRRASNLTAREQAKIEEYVERLVAEKYPPGVAEQDPGVAEQPRGSLDNTVVSRDGRQMYLGGLRSPLLFVTDTTKH